MTPSPPPPDLADDLACSWSARPTGRHRLIPDGCIDVLWLDDGGLWVCGPESAAWDFELPHGRHAVGVRFRPGVAARVLRVDVDDLLDRREPLGSLLGGRAERRASERIGDAADHQAAIVECARSWVASAPGGDERDRGLAVELTRPRPPTVDQLCERIGLSSRQLRRRSARTLGYPPATFVRLIRFQRFLRSARSAPTVSAAAATAGYADHPHLVRECRAIAGSAPTELLQWYEPTFPGVSDPYKTAVGRVATIGS
ncbi:MAG: DUF6597 domain-containing transcriptional factor [Actinomycetota bacterium]